MTDHVKSLQIEPITKKHIRDQFDCGNTVLNEYLKKYARQNDENNMARAYVAVGDDTLVLGYCCISTASIDFEELPEAQRKTLPKYPIPAALIGKLACDQSMQEQGLGARLLIDALQRIVSTAKEMGIKVIIVDAINEKAKSFYQHYGFMALDGQDKKLFLMIETAKALF